MTTTTTYLGFTRDAYITNLAGFQAQHSRGLMTDTWITPREFLEKHIAECEMILNNWDTLAVTREDTTVDVTGPNVEVR